MFKIIFSNLIIISIFASCVSTRKGITPGPTLNSNLYNGKESFLTGRDEAKGNFIELKDGSIVKGDKILLKDKNFQKTYFTVDGVDYVASDVVRMQNEFGFFERWNDILIARVDKNPISLYKYYYERKTKNTNGSATIDVVEAFVMKKDDKMSAVTPKTVREFVIDSESSTEMYNEYVKQEKKITKLSLSTLPLAVGGAVLMAKYAKDKKNFDDGTSLKEPNPSTVTIGGVGALLGIFGGRLILARKTIKNQITMLQIIEDYNAFAIRKGQKK
jgi:hypothetical protein